MTEHPRLPIVAIVDARWLLVVVLVGAAAWRARAVFRSWRARRRMTRALDGESTAHALLARRGYAIVARQAPGALVLHVDGAESAHSVRADFIVERRGVRWVAEVKTGARAPSLDHAPTRRQILEYCAAFDVAGALLVDAEAGVVREIAAPWRRARPSITSIALGVALGATLTWLLR